MKKKLIDISYHNEANSTIDFNKVAENIDGIILREGYRFTIDDKFLSFVDRCRKSGIKIVGVYHFIYALTSYNAIDEAINCVNNVKKAGLNPDDIYIFSDYEYDTVENAARKGVTLTKHDCNVFTEAFCAAITNLGYKAGIYTNLDYYKHYYIDALKNKYPIWLADYNGDPDFKCIIQQYSSSGAVPGIDGPVDMNYLFEDDKPSDSEPTKVSKVIELAESWVGKNEKDGSYKEIIDIYNSYTGKFPRGIKMQYDWSWCACTWSALAIKLGYTNIMPIEISCGELIKAAQKMGCWIENDGHIPKIGDAVLYDWQDSGKGDNVGWTDHVGLVSFVSKESGYFVVIEGNYSDSVKKRTVSINGRYIRGFISPKYDIEDTGSNAIISGKDLDLIAHEVIAGQWGYGDDRKNALTSNGYDYDAVQKRVNEILNGSAIRFPDNPNVDIDQPYDKKVISTCFAKHSDPKYYGTYVTTSDLYMRNDAGTNKKAIIVIPSGTKIESKGYYTYSNGVLWLYVNFIMNRVYYGGFCSSKYLVKQ